MGIFSSVQLSLVTQSCLTLCDPMDYSMPGFPVHQQLLELSQTHVHQVGDAILCCPLLLLLSISPSIRIFSSEVALHIRKPKYWSFSTSPSNEYSGLISLGLRGCISLLSKGLSRVFSSTTVQSILVLFKNDLYIQRKRNTISQRNIFISMFIKA